MTIAMSCDEDAGRWVYWARALCWQLYADYYDEKSCIQTMLLGIEQEEVEVTELQLILSPNPTSSEFTVDWCPNKSESGNLYVYDLNGRLIHAERNVTTGQTVNAAQWSEGTYLVKLVGQKSVRSGKVIIQR